MLKTNKDIALQSRDDVEQCFARFGGITFKLGTFYNSNVLFPPVSMEFCLLLFIKTSINRGRVFCLNEGI